MNEIEGFVLNGGKSSRMGSAKGSLRIGEQTFLEHAVSALRSVCDRVYVVGGDSVIEGVEIVADTPWKGENEKASMFGLRSALYNCSAPFTAVLACDMPFVTGDVMNRLAERNGVLESGRADVVIPLDPSGWLQPLCAIYERDRCKVVIDDLLETGSLQVSDLIGQMRVQTIEFSTFSDLACAEYLFSNINTPGDLQSATTLWSNRKQTS